MSRSRHLLPPESQEVTEGLPVMSHTYTILLEPNEEDTVDALAPRLFRDRVRQRAYTYVFFSSRSAPLLALGVWGDIWLHTAPGVEGIYFKNRGERWVPMRRVGSDMGTEVTRQFVYHPWLRKRTLQFDGTKLGWFRSNEWLRSRAAWDEWLRLQVSVPSSPDIRTVWVARYLAQRMNPTTTKTPRIAEDVSSPSETASSPGAALVSDTEAIPSQSEAGTSVTSEPESSSRSKHTSPSFSSKSTSDPSSSNSSSSSESVNTKPAPSSSHSKSASPSSKSKSTSSSVIPKSSSLSTPRTTLTAKENAPPAGMKTTVSSGPRSIPRTGLIAAVLSSHIRTMPLQNSTNLPSIRTVVPPLGPRKKPNLAPPSKAAPEASKNVKSPAAIIKREEGVSLPLCGKRPRVPDPSASTDEAPSKRLKFEEDDETARKFLRSFSGDHKEAESNADEDTAPGSSVRTADVHDDAQPALLTTNQSSVEAQGDCAVGQFLAGLPVPLDHHTSLFLSLGIADMLYIKSIAAMPQHILNELIFALQDHGLSFIEALVLRDALDAFPLDKSLSLRRTSLLDAGRPGDRVDVFLNNLRPSMVHHTPALRELGMHFNGHLITLAVMEAHRYATFETKLRRKGLTWMDCFIFRVAVQGY